MHTARGVGGQKAQLIPVYLWAETDMQNNNVALANLMQRNEDPLGGWAYRVTEKEIDQINLIPRPRGDNKISMRCLFFPKLGDKLAFFKTMSDMAFQRAE
jgi:hypothetical protein